MRRTMAIRKPDSGMVGAAARASCAACRPVACQAIAGAYGIAMNHSRSAFFNRLIIGLMGCITALQAGDATATPIQVPTGVYQRGDRYDVEFSPNGKSPSFNSLGMTFNSEGRPTEIRWMYLNRVVKGIAEAEAAVLATPGFSKGNPETQDGVVFRLFEKDTLIISLSESPAGQNIFNADKVEGSAHVRNGTPLPVTRKEPNSARKPAAVALQLPNIGILGKPYTGMDDAITGNDSLKDIDVTVVIGGDGINNIIMMNIYHPKVAADEFRSQFLKTFPDFKPTNGDPTWDVASPNASAFIRASNDMLCVRVDRKLRKER